MHKNIYLKELKNYKKSTLWWSVGVIFLIVTAMMKYEGYAQSDTSIEELFSSLPSGFNSFYGIGTVDLQSAGGFFAILVLYLSIMLGIQALLLGSRIISKEETDKTAEFIFIKPITRLKILNSKMLAGLTIVLTLNVVTTVSSLIIVGLLSDVVSAGRDVLLLMPGLFMIQLLFFYIGFGLASMLNKPKNAGKFAGALLLATFLFSAFNDITDKFSFIKYLTPFKYFDPKHIYAERSYNFIYIVISVVIVAELLIWARMRFQKRDLDI